MLGFNRIAKVRDILQEKGLDGILLSNIHNITYVTQYFNPLFTPEEREIFVLITKNNAYVFTDARYTNAVQQFVPDFILKERSQQTPIKKLLEEIYKNESLQKIGFEADNVTYAEYIHFTSEKVEFAPVDLRTLRIKKDTEEIEKIRNACLLGDEALSHARKKIKRGVTEKELAVTIELFVRQRGANMSFSPIVAFHENAATPHHAPTDRKLHDNEYVLFDLGTKIDGYCSDMTRTFFFGKPNGRQKKIYQTVLDAQTKVIEYIKEKLKIHEAIHAEEVDNTAREYIIAQDFPTIPHGLGHGTGLQVHESPRLSPASKDILEEGMVFSIEPGIYLPNEGGVRIEDLVAITNGKLEILTKSPKEFATI